MRRVHTTYDLLEAHMLIALLREHDIEACLFDADFVRQDWFKAIAYGGYRVMVRDEEVNEARTLLSAYLDGALALSGEHAAPCPNCTRNTGVDDPQPRRNVFLMMLALPVVEFIAFLHWKLSPIGILVAFFVQFFLYAAVPWLVIRYFKWRMCCDACGHRWREPPGSRYADLSRLATTGETAAP